ncbi:MAG: hypothetical protein CMK59_00645 [Proteobacteria bacterium]|nr:hypothetical protein [Pseudomonadota bacterium]
MIWLLIGCNKNTPIEQNQCVYNSFLESDDSSFFSSDTNCQTIEVSTRILGDGDFSIEWEQESNSLTPTLVAHEEGVFNGLILEGTYQLNGAAQPLIWKQGYQSWWWSGITELTTPELDINNLPLVGGDGDGIDATEEKPYSSWWVGLVGKKDGDSLLVGALSATRTRFWTAFSEEELWIVWGARGEAIQVEAGDKIKLDPVWIKGGKDPYDLHIEYAQAAAKHLNVIPPENPPPIGWATWYTYYEEISEDIIRANLSSAIELNGLNNTSPITLFQIDDGWQERWGDWTANEHFPSGMTVLAEDIKEAGFEPGLWMAPFYVSEHSALIEEHPDWWVLDSDGTPIRFSNLGTGIYHIIDVTHPEAGPWMRDQVLARKQEGWSYLKLDFLYAGAQEGTRYADVTGMEAYHIGMTYLKEAVGDGFFLACGAPMLPSLGYADAFRTGADIGFSFDPGPRREYLRWQIRSTAARSWMNGIWWWNDPDQMLIREPFNDQEVTGSIASNLASGGSWLLGDELFSVPQERLLLQLDPEITSKIGLKVRPVDPFSFISGPDIGPVSELTTPDDNVPTHWELEDGTTVLLNMSDRILDVKAPTGREFFSGVEHSTEQMRTLAPGQGEIWFAP